MGDGWLSTHADLFSDSPETRELVTGPHTTRRTCELLPELPMYLVKGQDMLDLWALTEEFAAAKMGSDSHGGEREREADSDCSSGGGAAAGGGDLHPPYWAVPWVGGQGVARYILDNPEVVRGKTVLDVGSGCGVAALAAARAGAALVCANDIDPLAAVAFLVNAEACGLEGGTPGTGTGTGTVGCALETSFEDLLGCSAADVAHFDVIMAGDVCFMKGLADAFQAWLASVSDRREGCVTILGDPSRNEKWAPRPGWAAGMERVAEYEVTTDPADINPLTEAMTTRHTVVWKK